MNQRALFLQHIAQTSDAPLALEIKHAEGCYLYDAAGKQYLDLIGGISVCNIGHRHPAVVSSYQRTGRSNTCMYWYMESLFNRRRCKYAKAAGR